MSDYDISVHMTKDGNFVGTVYRNGYSVWVTSPCSTYYQAEQAAEAEKERRERMEG